MSALAVPADSVTMSSLDLLDLVNDARNEFGEGEVRRNDFTARCKDELAGEHYETFVVTNSNGTESDGIQMNRDQCMYVLMRESKAVRRQVTTRLKTATHQPDLESEEGKLLMIQDLAAKQLVLLKENKLIAGQRDHAIATKALIGSKREATAMATASSATRRANRLEEELGRNQRHATVIAVEKALDRKFGKQDWRPLRQWCREHALQPASVSDPRYGEVKAWPAEAWKAVYNIDLLTVFAHPEVATH